MADGASALGGTNGASIGSQGGLASAAPASQCGEKKCGVDITRALGRLRQVLLDAMKSQRRKDQICKDAGGGLFPRFYNQGNGWDICELAWNKHIFCQQKEGCCVGEECSDSVMVSGECWKSHHVNYWLWGFLQKQCGFALADDAALVHFHRLFTAALAPLIGSSEPVDSNARICWVVSGYHDSMKGSIPRIGCSAYVLPCEECDEYAGELTATIRVANRFGDGSDHLLRFRHNSPPWTFSVNTIRDAKGDLNPNAPVRDCNKK
jgi:hypothetical protein